MIMNRAGSFDLKKKKIIKIKTDHGIWEDEKEGIRNSVSKAISISLFAEK